jgi:hypothetical protein
LEVYKECSGADWDGYGAVAVTPDAYEEAKRIIDLLPSSIRLPEIDIHYVCGSPVKGKMTLIFKAADDKKAPKKLTSWIVHR